ncbi:MAG: GFA family protein [bacterium]|nr:GFA family protein [bacterium]
MSLAGGCFCGAVRYLAGGTPFDVTHCHCRDCRRVAGAPFVTWFSVRAGELRVDGTPVRLASSADVERTFCGRCGTPLTWRRRGHDAIDVTAASLDDPAAVTPADHTWTGQQLPWICLGDGLPRHERTRPAVVA